MRDIYLCVTLLRDTVERVISQYFHARRGYHKRGPLRRWLRHGQPGTAGRYSFGGYLSCLCEHQRLYVSIMSCCITGSRECDNPAPFLFDHYFHYGVLERMDDFAHGLGRKPGHPVTTASRNVRRADRAFHFPPMSRTG
ncbi:MAG: hypothetical protein HKP57_06630 [Halobacteria archaeon]|nr:hypothetical protein [Halobacteria archaeon]